MAPCVEEELQVPHQAAERGKQNISDDERFCPREVRFYRQFFHFCQPNKAESEVYQRAAAHDDHVARQGGVQRVNPQRRGGFVHRFGGVHRKRHPRRENTAHHRQQQAFFEVKVFGLNAHFALFQLPRSGHNGDANHRDQYAEERHLTAFGID